MQKPTLVLTFEFAARPQRVFDVLTQSEHLNRWLTTEAQVDLQVRGRITTADGETGKFLKVAVPRHLVFTYTADRIGIETEVDITIQPSGPGRRTRMRIVQKGLDPAKVSADAYGWQTERWNFLGESLQRYLAGAHRISFDAWRTQRRPVYGTRR